jgi:hypothetical protein
VFMSDFTTERDEGAGPERRAACVVRVWCVLELGHTGPCVEAPRGTNHDRPDWDKRTPDPRGWNERKRNR